MSGWNKARRGEAQPASQPASDPDNSFISGGPTDEVWLKAFLDLIHIITSSHHIAQCSASRPPKSEDIEPGKTSRHTPGLARQILLFWDWKSEIINKICSKSPSKFFLFRRQEYFFLLLNINQSRERQRERLERMKHESILGPFVSRWYLHFYHIKTREDTGDVTKLWSLESVGGCNER